MSTSVFAEWFGRQLKRRQWSNSEFARQSGVPTSTVSAWRRGTRTPDPPLSIVIADTFDLDRDLVLDLAGHRPATEPLAPDDPATDIVSKVRRVRWNPERVEHITYELDLYLKYDKIAREKGKEGET